MKQIACASCNKSFKCRDELRRHEKIHLGRPVGEERRRQGRERRQQRSTCKVADIFSSCTSAENEGKGQEEPSTTGVFSSGRVGGKITAARLFFLLRVQYRITGILFYEVSVRKFLSEVTRILILKDLEWNIFARNLYSRTTIFLCLKIAVSSIFVVQESLFFTGFPGYFETFF
jgi:hypothetical protein